MDVVARCLIDGPTVVCGVPVDQYPIAGCCAEKRLHSYQTAKSVK